MNTTQFTKIQSKLKSALDPDAVNRLGKECGFAVRERCVTPHRLAIAMLTAFAVGKTETIADILRTFNALTDYHVQYKPFHNQLSKETFPEFMRLLLERLLAELTLEVLSPLPQSALRDFTDITIQDGSSFALKDSLRHIFPGRFTKVSPAAVEIHATMSLYQDQAITVSIAPDSQGERDFRPEPNSLRGQLFLADRGYEDTQYGLDIRDAGGSFIIRYKGQLNPVIQSCIVDGKPVPRLKNARLKDIRRKLKGKTADLDVVWPRFRDMAPLRLVMLWNPELKQHMFLLTNLDRTKFPPAVVRRIYSLRWQVELLFKEWKSYANLHAFQTGKQHIAEGLMWASLAAALLKRFLAHATQMLFSGVETSTRRVAMALTHHFQTLARALLAGHKLGAALQAILAFLRFNGLRAHPKRDRKHGRLELGLAPLHELQPIR